MASASLAPWRAMERAWFQRAAKECVLEPDPVFIIGHWQAGHSLMHEYLLRDRRFARINLLHSVLPSCFRTLQRPVSGILGRRLPKTRGVDSLPLSLAAPQGDDFMMAGLSDLSLYYGYVFPASYRKVLNRALLFTDVRESEVETWKNTYKQTLQRVAHAQNRRWIVSRNASNTTRIPQILEMYPGAKFIHMYRNPWAVFAAQSSRLESLTGRWCLQPSDAMQFQSVTLDFYVTMMERFFETRELIPEGHLIEVKYEDLLTEPESTMARVYGQLQLGQPDMNDSTFPEREVDSGKLAGDARILDNAAISLVSQRWNLTIDRWGYSPPESG